jgi:hypothetical protein
MKKSIHLSIFYSLFILTLIYVFLFSIIKGYEKESWNITEFLINYQGGFVRRGLLGEILLNIYNFSGLSPYVPILLLCLAAYFLLLFFFIKSFLKNGYPIFILPFVFFLGNPVINDFWVRKDILITLFFIAIIYFAAKKSNLYLILVNLLFMTGLLIHESIGFFCFPILLFILAGRKRFFDKTKAAAIKSFFYSFLQLLPSAITFLSVLYYRGSQKTAGLIWESWKAVAFPLQKNGDEIPTAIDTLSWSFKKALSYGVETMGNFDGGVYAPIAWLMIISLIYFVLTNTDKLNVKILNHRPNRNFNRTNISNILIFQLFSVLPLFILGYDYGRWVFFWVTSSFAIIILIPEENLSLIFPRYICAVSSRINIILDSILGKSGDFLFFLCLVICFPPCGWNLMTCVFNSAIVTILNFISHIILFIKYAVS